MEQNEAFSLDRQLRLHSTSRVRYILIIMKLKSLKETVLSAKFLILYLAIIFRFGFGLNWDSGALSHPDESFLIQQSYKIQTPRTFTEYLDESSSPANPLNFGAPLYVYGTLPLFVEHALTKTLGPQPIRERAVRVRYVTAILDFASIFIVGAAIEYLISSSAAIWAMFFMATSVLNIQLCRFYTVDSFLYFFLSLSFFFFIRWAAQIGLLESDKLAPRVSPLHSALSFSAAGSSFGAAMACKLSAVLIAPAILLLFIAALRKRLVLSRLLEAVLGFYAFAFAFRVLQPYTFAEPSLFSFRISERWLSQMQSLKEMTGGIFYPPSIQWVDRTPIFFSLKNLFLWSPGIFFSLSVLIGTYLLVRRKSFNISNLFILTWLFIPLIWISWGFIKPTRYFWPIIPAAAAIAGLAISWLRKNGGIQKIIAVILVTGQLLWAWTFTAIYREPLTRADASRWIMDNLSCNVAIAIEYWDDPLPLPLIGRYPARDCYERNVLRMYDEETPEKIEHIISVLSNSDYYVISSQRIRLSVDRLPDSYPIAREFYKRLFAGELGFSIIRSFESFPSFLGIKFIDMYAEESISVYDHPKVFIFKRDSNFSPDRVRDLLWGFSPQPLPARLK